MKGGQRGFIDTRAKRERECEAIGAGELTDEVVGAVEVEALPLAVLVTSLPVFST